MKKLIFVLLTILILAMLIVPSNARERITTQSSPPMKTQLLACNFICDAGLLGGFSPLAYLWKDVHDVEDIDIKSGGLSPSSIRGTAWTRSNDGHGRGLDADKLDGKHKNYFLKKINTLNKRNKKLNKRVTSLTKKLKALTNHVNALH